jgi:hypothetical protein
LRRSAREARRRAGIRWSWDRADVPRAQLTLPLMRPGLPFAQPILQGRGIESSECI